MIKYFLCGFIIVSFILGPVSTISAENVTWENVTFPGPYTGSFGIGVVVATATGNNIVQGSLNASPNSVLSPFSEDQLVGITDQGDSGAFVHFGFSGETFDADDAFFISSLQTERDVVVTAKKAATVIDANWSILEWSILDGSGRTTTTFDDDGDSGINATLQGIPEERAGVLLRSGVGEIDEILISWKGNGPGNRGLQLGITNGIPEPSTIALLAMGAVGLLLYALRKRKWLMGSEPQ